MLKKEAIEIFLSRKLESHDWIKEVKDHELDEAIEEIGYRNSLRLTPRLHQKASFYLCATTNNFILHLDMGLGKTAISLMTFNFLRQKKKAKKMLAVVPNVVNIKNWEEQIEEFSDYKSVMLYGSAKDRQLLLSEDADIFIINYEGLPVLMTTLQSVKNKKNKKRIYDHDLAKDFEDMFDMIVLDEIHKCFHESTSIITSEGSKQISSVSKGDSVKTLNGTFSEVSNVFKNKVNLNDICKVVIGSKEIVCSTSHLFFTEKGWVRAKDLKDTIVFFSYAFYNGQKISNGEENGITNKKLCFLWKRISNKSFFRKTERKRTSFLWNELFSKMETYFTSHKRIKQIRTKIFESKISHSKDERRKSRKSSKNISRAFSKIKKIKSDAQRGCKKESFANKRIEWNASYLEWSKRWKWILHKRTINTLWISYREKSKLDFRIPNLYRTLTTKRWAWISYKLQSGHWKSRIKDWCRNRWGITHTDSHSIEGQKKRNEIIGIRVDSVEIYEQGRNDESFYGYISNTDISRGYCYFYDLEVKDHPSYYANGFLVHNCKNKDSLTFELCDKICQRTKYRYGLTGTPLGKDSQDLWSQFYLIDRGETLGSGITLFRQAFFNAKPGHFGGMDYFLDKKKEPILSGFIKNKSIYYADHECGDLPKQVFITKHVEYSPQGMKEIHELRKRAKDSAMNNEVMKENLYNKGRQICSGFLYEKISQKEKIALRFPSNPKLDELEELMNTLPIGQKIVIFYHFDESGKMIRERLKKLKIKFNGGGDDTIKEYEAFKKDPKSRAFVIQIASGSTGLNLQNAAYCLYYEPIDNPITYQQSLKRIHRQGQVSSRVYYYFFVVKNSVEEKMYNSLKEGIDISRAILSGKVKLEDII